MAHERYDRDPRDYRAQDRDAYSDTRGDRYGGYDSRPSGYFGRGEWNDRGGSQADTRREGGYGAGGYGRNDRFGTTYGGGDRDRFTDVEDYGRANPRQRTGYGRPPQGYDHQDRGFIDRAGDEVRSWFGDEEAERRRELDARYDQRSGHDRDSDYGAWRKSQIDALDRDYQEYRTENRSKFETEFSSWRNERQGQRTSLGSVKEHMEVVGSDGSHVGTVDKVRGDRIVLTKNDQDAGGRHHSIPSRWIDKVDDKVTLRKTADEAQTEWRDEERNQAFFSEGRDRSSDDDRGGHMLNRSFSGTY